MAAVQASAPLVGDGNGDGNAGNAATTAAVPAAVPTITATAPVTTAATTLPEEPTELLVLYAYFQHFSHLIGNQARDMLIQHFKDRRPTIIAQANAIPDPYERDIFLYSFSPPLFPDRPGAMGDVPSASFVAHDMARLKIAAFEEGLKFGQLLLQSGTTAGIDPGPVDDDLYATKVQLLTNPLAMRSLGLGMPPDGGVPPDAGMPPTKRARFDGGGDDSSNNNNDNSSGSSDSDSDDSADPGQNMDLDVDSPVVDDAGAGTGMLDLPLRTRNNKATMATVDEEQRWHKLPYESRLHKLGPGMTRAPLLPADEFVRADKLLPADKFVPAKKSSRPRVARYKGRGVPPRFATWREANERARDDYADCRDYFAWEVEHGRAAPAVLPRDQLLPYVPLRPVLPLPADDPKLPPGPVQRDDVWPPEPARTNGQTAANGQTQTVAVTSKAKATADADADEDSLFGGHSEGEDSGGAGAGNPTGGDKHDADKGKGRGWLNLNWVKTAA